MQENKIENGWIIKIFITNTGKKEANEVYKRIENLANKLTSIGPTIKISKLQEFELEEIAIVDIETTGLNISDAIVEIGICKLNLKTGDITPLLKEICQEHDKKIDPNAWVFNHSDLKYYDVKKAPDLTTFSEEIQRIFNKYPMTAYNQNFDFKFLKNRGFTIEKEFWDPMFKAQYILKIPRYNGEYKWPSFQEAWNYFFPNHKYSESHRAYDDALHEAQLVYEIYKREKKVK